MTNELTVSGSNYSIMPVMDITQAKQRRQAIIDFVGGLMVSDVHYGKIPGTKKDTLMKPGAEMLTTFFGLAPRFVAESVIEDWTGADHDGEPFFYYRYRCELRRGDTVAGDGIGSCNSWEGKYRYRNASKTCPNCGSEAIIKGKAEYGGGWLCFAKKGGCGSKFRDGDQAIEGQKTGKVKNDNPQDIVNTIDKMAQKRALVAATLIAVNASEFFTQDVEDMDFGIVEGEIIQEGKPQVPQRQPQPTPPHPQVRDNYTDSFLQYCVDNIERYENTFAVRNALKKQYTEETGDKKEMMNRFEWLKQHAEERDNEESISLVPDEQAETLPFDMEDLPDSSTGAFSD